MGQLLTVWQWLWEGEDYLSCLLKYLRGKGGFIITIFGWNGKFANLIKPKKAMQQAAHIILLLYEQGSIGNASLIFCMMCVVIGSLILEGWCAAWRFLIPLKIFCKCGVSWRLNFTWCPVETCSCLTAARYTLMVPYAMLVSATYATKCTRMVSETGTGQHLKDLQKLRNLCCPAD